MSAAPATPTCPGCPGNPEDSTSRSFSFSSDSHHQLQPQSRLQRPRSWGWNLRKCQPWGTVFGDGVRSQLLIKLTSDGVFW